MSQVSDVGHMFYEAAGFNQCFGGQMQPLRRKLAIKSFLQLIATEPNQFDALTVSYKTQITWA